MPSMEACSFTKFVKGTIFTVFTGVISTMADFYTNSPISIEYLLILVKFYDKTVELRFLVEYLNPFWAQVCTIIVDWLVENVRELLGLGSSKQHFFTLKETSKFFQLLWNFCLQHLKFFSLILNIWFVVFTSKVKILKTLSK